MLVSEPEKKAEKSTSNAIELKRIQRGISFNLKGPKKGMRYIKYSRSKNYIQDSYYYN